MLGLHCLVLGLHPGADGPCIADVGGRGVRGWGRGGCSLVMIPSDLGMGDDLAPAMGDLASPSIYCYSINSSQTLLDVVILVGQVGSSGMCIIIHCRHLAVDAPSATRHQPGLEAHLHVHTVGTWGRSPAYAA